jgi:HEAT repeat protein
MRFLVGSHLSSLVAGQFAGNITGYQPFVLNPPTTTASPLHQPISHFLHHPGTAQDPFAIQQPWQGTGLLIANSSDYDPVRNVDDKKESNSAATNENEPLVANPSPKSHPLSTTTPSREIASSAKDRGDRTKKLPMSTMALPDNVKEEVSKIIDDRNTSLYPVSKGVLLYGIGDLRGYQLLKEIAREGHDFDREMIAWYAGEMGETGGVRLLELLIADVNVWAHIQASDADDRIQLEIARAAGKIGGGKGAWILEQLANSSSELVRIEVVNSAGKIGGKEGLRVIESFKKQTHLSDPFAKAVATTAGEIGGPEGIKVLESLKYIQQMDVVRGVVLAAAKIGGKEGLSIIEFVRDNVDPSLSYLIAMAAGEYGGKEGIKLLHSIRSSWDDLLANLEVVKAAGKIGGDKGWEIIQQVGKFDSLENFYAMIEAAGMYGDARGIRLLEVFSSKEDARIQSEVARAAGKMVVEDGDAYTLARRKQLLEYLKGNPDRTVRQAVAEAAGDVGGSDGIRLLNVLRFDSNVYVRSAVAVSAGKIGGEEGVRILEFLKGDDCIEVHYERLNAAGEIGGPEGLRLLQEYEAHNTSQKDHIAAAAGKIGGIEALRILLSPDMPSPPSFIVRVLKSMEIHTDSSPPPPHPAKEVASIIRAVVRRMGRDALPLARGFLNRGYHRGKRADSAGFDFREWRAVQSGHPLSGRLNYNRVVVRRNRVTGAEEIAGGELLEARYDQAQAVHSMILVDPSVLNISETATAVGTVAQMNLQNQDPVGLMIGDGKEGAFMKPSTKPGTLEYSLMKIMNEDYTFIDAQIALLTNDAGEIVEKYVGGMSAIELLEQGLLRKNLPTGSQLYFFSNFSTEENLEGLGKVIERYRARGVTVVPVQAGNVAMEVHTREVVIGRHRFQVNPGYVREMERVRGKWKAEEVTDFLERYSGIKVPFSGNAQPHVVAEAMIREMRAENPDLSIDVDVLQSGFVSEMHIPETEPPANLFDMIDSIVERKNFDDLSSLMFTAKVNGWSSVIDWVEGMISNSNAPSLGMNQVRDASAVDLRDIGSFGRDLYGFRGIFSAQSLSYARWLVGRHKRDIEDFVREGGSANNAMALKAVLRTYDDPRLRDQIGLFAGPWDVEMWCYSETGLRRVLGVAHEMSKRKSYPSMPDAPRPGSQSPQASEVHVSAMKELNANTSAVTIGSEKSGKGVIWLNLSRPLTGDSPYLALGIYGRHDPARGAYRELSGFTLDYFTSPGGKSVKGTLIPGVAVVDMPAPLGGEVVGRGRSMLGFGKSETVDLRLSGVGPADGIFDISLSGLRESGTKLYGNNYDVLTEAPSFEQMPKDVQNFVKGLEGKKVGEAIAAIQAFVVKNFQYGGYEKGSSRRTVFDSLKERMLKGELKGPNEYLDFVLQSRTGKCNELSEVTVALLRMAGIPAAKCHCYLAKGTKVDAESHAVAVAILPSNKGGWYAKPVETSVSLLSGPEKTRIEAVAEELTPKPEEALADAVADEPTDTNGAHSNDIAGNESGISVAKDTSAASVELFRGVEKLWEERWEQASGPERAEMSRMWGFYHHVMAYRGLTFMSVDAAELMLTPQQYALFKTSTVKSPAAWMRDIGNLGVSEDQLAYYMLVWERNQ